MPKKSNVKFDQSGEPGPNEALGSTNEGATDDSSILGAIAALHAELTLVKSEICRKIETEISEELTEAANGSSDIVQELESKVKTLCGQVETLSEKCLDLEGCSKRQNLRVAGVKEGKENGQRTRLFVAELLKETLGLENAPEIDRAHRALRRRAGDNEPPRHLIARVHSCPAFEDIMKKVISTRDLTFKGGYYATSLESDSGYYTQPSYECHTRAQRGSLQIRRRLGNTRNVSSGLQRRSKMSALHSGAKTKRP
ncbi:LINE-1 retrotransposable element ORF1 protein [Dissostichus eleginoides]|uniref:LINE-1 retrotransposable element ORF1 protein n=1 Tax=Dissostichus eleginoides TaxID=100907 RepID=A0AAD9CET0_DISEL|nr:LINE-1 retrotransposable element ORF1 protein [Dissostichus eleginoides]